MTILRISVIVSAAILAGGCVNLSPRVEKPPRNPVSEPHEYRRLELESVTLYGGYIAGLSGSERLAECKRLMHGEVGNPEDLSIRLHTAMIMTLTPECGGPETALPILESLRSEVLPPELRSLVKYQLVLASDLVVRAEKSGDLEKQIERQEIDIESLKNRLHAKDNELLQLKATLDALKKIEKTFHKRNE
ncbi:MAG: hypothetical protein ACU843_01150 [Gammaproteobacteria bacterium]